MQVVKDTPSVISAKVSKNKHCIEFSKNSKNMSETCDVPVQFCKEDQYFYGYNHELIYVLFREYLHPNGLNPTTLLYEA